MTRPCAEKAPSLACRLPPSGGSCLRFLSRCITTTCSWLYLQLVVRNDRQFVFKRLADLKGKKIGGGLGVSYGQAVDTALQKGLFSMERDTDATERVFKVLQGRLDAAVIGHGMPGYEAVVTSNVRLAARYDELVVLPTPLERDPLYFAMRKTMEQQGVVARLNKALREMRSVAAVKSRP